MTSKEALENLINKTGIINDTCAHLLACVKCGKCKFEEPIETCADYQLVMTIEKDLEILECFKKIDKKELNDFIENQIKYALNENSWLSTCNCDLEKEEPTQHLIKIKEWLEDENNK